MVTRHTISQNKMGLLYREYINGGSIISCHKCSTHLSAQDKVISKAFNGHFGRAYLMHDVINTYQGEMEDRAMATGLHTVREIFCISCQLYLGWRYVIAHDPTQKYKEGRVVLEATRLKFDIP